MIVRYGSDYALELISENMGEQEYKVTNRDTGDEDYITVNERDIEEKGERKALADAVYWQILVPESKREDARLEALN
ncbi:hypothetical protein L3V16_21075 [Brucella ciceri]|uniref:hypothetical protein n=1 Tax=Brucella ciceri TaxID=391287 RepID=UPI0013B047A7|nr:hypothetical protein [Brucella ciceri]MCH6206320.1 hypothetical protein [Brucella ciceri]